MSLLLAVMMMMMSDDCYESESVGKVEFVSGGQECGSGEYVAA